MTSLLYAGMRRLLKCKQTLLPFFHVVLGNIRNLDAGNLAGLMDVELCVSISEIGNKIESEIYIYTVKLGGLDQKIVFQNSQPL